LERLKATKSAVTSLFAPAPTGPGGRGPTPPRLAHPAHHPNKPTNLQTNDPQRCTTCRAAAKQARTASPSGAREYHAAVCNSCGGQAVVPFQPRNDRPVYCSSCFDRVRAEASAPA
jgi:CxxC-x17-CxxC domain-containing protein